MCVKLHHIHIIKKFKIRGRRRRGVGVSRPSPIIYMGDQISFGPTNNKFPIIQKENGLKEK